MFSILCIDDDSETHDYLNLIIPGNCCLESIRDMAGLQDIPRLEPDLAFLDIDFCMGSGRRLLSWLREALHPVPIIILSHSQEVTGVVSCLKEGAADYLVKPISRQLLLGKIGSIGKIRPPERFFRTELDLVLGFGRNVSRFRSIAMQFGTTGACCLVTGETGSGKYQLAQQLHAQVFSDAGRGYSEGLRDRFLPWSPRGQGLESQERGLFGTTGSSHVRGVIDGLDGGTLMIEDAECLHPDIQLRLATILERGFMDYGQSGRRVPVRLRLILSSAKCNSAELITSVFCRKLSGEVARKRMDLRSLRDRQTDLIAIAWYFMEMVIRYMPDISCRSFSPPAMEKIFAYPWPGNLPEMRQCISEACFRAQGREILADDLVLPSLSI